jgi:transcriptional regulator with XRE-family HTH domain
MDEKELHARRLEMAGIIKNKRIELELTQQQLADKCEMGVNTVRRIEDGRFWLGTKQLLIICRALHLNLHID